MTVPTCQDGGAPQSMGTEAPVLGTLWTSPCIPLIWPFIGISYNKLVNINVSLSSVNYSSKLIQPEEGGEGTSDLKPTGWALPGSLLRISQG